MQARQILWPVLFALLNCGCASGHEGPPQVKGVYQDYTLAQYIETADAIVIAEVEQPEPHEFEVILDHTNLRSVIPVKAYFVRVERVLKEDPSVEPATWFSRGSGIYVAIKGMSRGDHAPSLAYWHQPRLKVGDRGILLLRHDKLFGGEHYLLADPIPTRYESVIRDTVR